jgi:hypothetical protein
MVALLDGAHIEEALARAQAEVDDDRIWDALDVQVRARVTDGGRLDEALCGRPLMTLEALGSTERTVVARCQWYASVAAAPADSPTLDVLEAATALLRALADDGDVTLALDVVTARWWSADELKRLWARRPFALDEHVNVVVEAVERRPGVGHLVRSRGLAKLARPDVGARGPRRDAERLSELLRDVARLLADGAPMGAGERLRAANLPPAVFIPRSDDALADASADEAPLYELRDLDEGGSPAATCERLLAALRPKPRLTVVK